MSGMIMRRQGVATAAAVLSLFACRSGLVRSQAEEELSSSSAAAASSPCGVWFAPSTIPGAGFGMFAGVDYVQGDEVTPGDLVVPYVDMPWHNSVERDDEIGFLWNEYGWDSTGFAWMDQEAHAVSAASFGIGAAPNCWLPLVNVADTTTVYDDEGLHRSRDPGAGAITPYKDRRGFATADIPAGMELFVDYGYSYFESRPQNYGPTPREEHYELGDELMAAFYNLTENVGWATHDATCDHDSEQACKSPVLDATAATHRKELYELILSLKDTFFSPVLATLPQDVGVVEYVAHHGVRFGEYLRSIQTIEWLEEHGTCMDNLREGKSSIPQAGRGAFAHRPIASGQVVAPLPLIHVDRNVLAMYGSVEEVHPDSPHHQADAERPLHQQLLLNYCFGHRDTQLLLCPYGVTTALINHSQQKANAKIVWSEKTMRQPEWLLQHPTEWIHELTAGLAFDLVATRDIQQGEEVLIDYGDEFEEAWNRHVQNWRPPSDAEAYVPAYKLDELEKIKTVAEGSYSSESKDIFCRDEFRIFAGFEKAEFHLHSCRATDRWQNADGDYRYNVELFERVEYFEADGYPDICFEILREVLFDVPRDCIFIEDAFYTRDHAQPWSFRHDMRIPDEIFPAAWIDVEEE